MSTDQEILDAVDNETVIDNSNPQQTSDTSTTPPETDAPVDSTSTPPADSPEAQPPASEAATRRSQAPAGTKPGDSANPISLQRDPIKELNDYKAQQGREIAQRDRELERLRTVESQFKTEAQQRQEQSDKLKLKRWDNDHPNHGDFKGLLSRRGALGQQLQALKATLPPEQFEAAQKALADATFSQEEQQELIDHRKMNDEFMLNPAANARQIAMETAREVSREGFAQFQQWNQAQSQVGTDLKSLTNEAKAELAPLLKDGVPYDAALELANARVELAKLRAGTSDVQRQQRQATEQQRLAKSQATITRDPKAAPITHTQVYDEAKKRALALGLNTAHPKFPRLLNQVEAELIPK